MGIVNVTPDSFWPGARHPTMQAAVAHALAAQRDGADIVDVGAESTRPGSLPVSLGVERRRLMPVLKKLLPRLTIPVSVDTTKAQIADEALDMGAAMINDTSGLSDPFMAEVVARHKACVVIMHRRGPSATMQKRPRYARGAVREIKDYFRQRIGIARAAGVPGERIFLDPGIGFGKTLEHNLEILRHLKDIALGHALLIGLSRKSFLGSLLDAEPEDRLAGSLAAGIWALLHGAAILRVHDVKETVHARKVLDALHAFRV